MWGYGWDVDVGLCGFFGAIIIFYAQHAGEVSIGRWGWRCPSLLVSMRMDEILRGFFVCWPLVWLFSMSDLFLHRKLLLIWVIHKRYNFESLYSEFFFLYV